MHTCICVGLAGAKGALGAPGADGPPGPDGKSLMWGICLFLNTAYQ